MYTVHYIKFNGLYAILDKSNVGHSFYKEFNTANERCRDLNRHYKVSKRAADKKNKSLTPMLKLVVSR